MNLFGPYVLLAIFDDVRHNYLSGIALFPVLQIWILKYPQS